MAWKFTTGNLWQMLKKSSSHPWILCSILQIISAIPADQGRRQWVLLNYYQIIIRGLISWETKEKNHKYMHTFTHSWKIWVKSCKVKKVSDLVSDFTLVVKHRRFDFYILFQQSCSDFQGVWLLQLDKHDYEWFAWGTFPGMLYKLSQTAEIVSVFSASQ